MEKTELIKKLGLPEDATDEQVSTAMDAAITKAMTPAPAPGPDITPPQQFEVLKRVDTETRLKAVHRKKTSRMDDEEKEIAKALDLLVVSRIGSRGIDRGDMLFEKNETEEVMKAALGVTSTNWMPNTFSTVWLGEVMQESLLRVIPMQTIYGASESHPVKPLPQRAVTFTDGSNIGTETSDPSAAVTLTPKGFGLLRTYSDRFAGAANPVDAASQIVEWLRESMSLSLDDAFINGDTASPHQDGDSSDVRNNILGLRANAVDNSVTADLSTFSIATVEGLIAKMKSYGIDGQNCYAILNYKLLSKMRALSGDDNDWRYFTDGAAPGIDVVGGMKALRYVAPDIVEGTDNKQVGVRCDLNASGLYDGTVVTYTCLPIFNARNWAWGMFPDQMTFKGVMTHTGVSLGCSAYAAITPVRSTMPAAAMGYKIS